MLKLLFKKYPDNINDILNNKNYKYPLFHYAMNHKAKHTLFEILKYPKFYDINSITRYKYNILYVMIECGEEQVVLKLLKNISPTIITEGTLMAAIYKNMENAVLEILKYIKHNDLDLLTSIKYNNETIAIALYECIKDKPFHINILIKAIEHKMETLSLKLLQHFMPSELNKIYSSFKLNNMTLLMMACYYKLEKVALKLLEKLPYHNLYYIEKNNGFTALIYACANKMEKVALKILIYPKLCNYKHIAKNGNSAYISAYINSMTNITNILDKLP